MIHDIILFTLGFALGHYWKTVIKFILSKIKK